MSRGAAPPCALPMSSPPLPLPSLQQQPACSPGADDEGLSADQEFQHADRKARDAAAPAALPLADDRLFGLDDSTFRCRHPRAAGAAAQGGLMTKFEARAVSLAKLALGRRSIVWDIGAGSGAVGLEAARIASAGFVYAIEKNPADAAIALDNARRLAVGNYALTQGRAPAGIEAWPSPDAVFIGGSGGELATLIELSLARLRAGGKLVINLVTLDNLATATAALERAQETGLADWEMLQLQAARSVPILSTRRFAAENPVWILTATRRGRAHSPDRFVLGIGCDRGSTAEGIAAAVAATLAAAGIDAGAVDACASSEIKADEAGLREFATTRGWPLHFFAAGELAAVAVPNPSAQAARHAGSASVAEAAARLAAGGGELVVTKQKFRAADGRHVTLALARLSASAEPKDAAR